MSISDSWYCLIIGTIIFIFGTFLGIEFFISDNINVFVNEDLFPHAVAGRANIPETSTTFLLE